MSKKKNHVMLSLCLCLFLLPVLTACGKKADPTGLWKEAAYQSDKELGKGSKTLKLEVKAGENTVTFTVHTDRSTVGEALLDNAIIEGEEGAYGLYVKKVNGILADYDVDQSYWAFYIDGEYAMTGVDGTEIEEDRVYQLVYEK